MEHEVKMAGHWTKKGRIIHDIHIIKEVNSTIFLQRAEQAR